MYFYLMCAFIWVFLLVSGVEGGKVPAELLPPPTCSDQQENLPLNVTFVGVFIVPVLPVRAPGSGLVKVGQRFGAGNTLGLAGLGFGTCSEHQKEPFNAWQAASKLEWQDNAKWMHCLKLIHLSSLLLTVKLVLSADP